MNTNAIPTYVMLSNGYLLLLRHRNDEAARNGYAAPHKPVQYLRFLG